MGTQRRKDITGQVFGKLTIVGYSHTTPNGAAMWNVKCSCGTEKKVSYGNLKCASVSSCGCNRKEGRNKKELGFASFNSKFSQYKLAAKKRNFCFELSKEEFKKIVLQNCVYCGQTPETNHHAKSCNGGFVSNGVDRVDSSKGYTLENCVPCCPVCNRMKLDLPLNVFTSHMEKILSHLRKV